MPASASERQTLTVPEAARLLGVDPRTLYDAIAAGRLYAIRLGVKLLIPKRTIDRLLDPEGAAR